MTWLRKYWLLAFGYLLFIYGALSMVGDYVWRKYLGVLSDLGILFGSGAIALLGLVTISVAKALRQLEERLEKIETGDRR